MSLATRCPACGTVFRVVQDQLRVSQGWVRCGRCSEPFNALESMVELAVAQAPEAPPQPDTAAPPPSAPSAGAPAPAANAPEPPLWSAGPQHTRAPPPEARLMPTDDAPAPGDDATSFVIADLPEPPPLRRRRADPPLIELPPGMDVIASDGAVAAVAEGLPSEEDRQEPPFDLDAPPAGALSAAAVDESVAVAPEAPPQALAEPAVEGSWSAAERHALAAAQPDDSAAPEAPSFLLRAEREARWRRPAVRALLWSLLLAASLALAGQASYAFRDRLAATFPQLRPALGGACAVLGCRIELFRQIDALSVESSGLVRVEGSSVYRLSVTLRNRSTIDVAAPALDLSLIDAQGQQVARRVLQMSDLHLPLRQLRGGTEIPIQVPLTVGDRQVSGYTVEIFYP